MHELMEALKARRIIPSRKEDEIFWTGSKSGHYKVKFGYVLQNPQVKSDWPSFLCWSKWTLPKAGAFAWIAIHKRILTSDRLKSLGITSPSRCVLCGKAEETIDHLLLTCPFASNCWDWLRQKLGWISALPDRIEDLFKGWPKGQKTT